MQQISLVCFVLLLTIQCALWAYDFWRNTENTKPAATSVPYTPEAVERRIATHEAGHAVMCHVLGLPVTGICVSPERSYTGTSFACYTAEDLHKLILVFYAGAAAEDIRHGDTGRLPGNGSTSESDFAKADRLLKDYIVLTDDTVSKTYLDVELADKMVAYSKQFYEEKP